MSWIGGVIIGQSITSERVASPCNGDTHTHNAKHLGEMRSKSL
jgi:hypothetical protein